MNGGDTDTGQLEKEKEAKQGEPLKLEQEVIRFKGEINDLDKKLQETVKHAVVAAKSLTWKCQRGTATSG